MERANRCTVQTTENGYEARFYRTHKYVATVVSTDTDWVADAEANSTTNRESFREYICRNAECHDIEWNPTKQTQAWGRKYNTYMTDEEVEEDTRVLVFPVFDRLADKGRYDMRIEYIRVVAVSPKESTLGYVENGRYTKSGAWCVADIELELSAYIGDDKMEIPFIVEMKSGQICKPKTTIAEWNEMVAREMELNGIIVEEQSDVA